MSTQMPDRIELPSTTLVRWEAPPLPEGGRCMPTCRCACDRNCGCREGSPVPTDKRPRPAGRQR